MIVAVNPSGKILNVPNLLSLFRIFLTFVGIVIFLLGPEFGDVFRGFIKITEKYSIQYTSFICF
jgi:phosphatidylglycerophosphate synthase